MFVLLAPVWATSSVIGLGFVPSNENQSHFGHRKVVKTGS